MVLLLSNKFGLQSTMHASVRPDPRRQARQATAPVRGMGELPFDFAATRSSWFQKRGMDSPSVGWNVVGDRQHVCDDRSHACHLPPRCDQLQVATGITDLMEVVGVIIFVANDITLNRPRFATYVPLSRARPCSWVPHANAGQGPIRSHQPHGFCSLLPCNWRYGYSPLDGP